MNKTMAVKMEISRSADSGDSRRTPSECPSRRREVRSSAGKGWSRARKVALLVGGLVGVWLLVSPQNPVTAGMRPLAWQNGVAAEDARLIPDAGRWAVIDPATLDSSFRYWLSGFGAQPNSRIKLDSRGSGEPTGVAYLLATAKAGDRKRVVWVADHQVVYDIVEKVQGIARVPASSLARMAWRAGSRPPETPEGDGLMIIRNYMEPNGIAVFFVQNGHIYSGVPEDLSNVELR